MKIKNIYYGSKFEKQFKFLPERIQSKAILKEKLFRDNPFYPSLRLHKLEGKLDGFWSISVNRAYRIIFKIMDDGNILFISIGLHAIYKS